VALGAGTGEKGPRNLRDREQKGTERTETAFTFKEDSPKTTQERSMKYKKRQYTEVKSVSKGKNQNEAA